MEALGRRFQREVAREINLKALNEEEKKMFEKSDKVDWEAICRSR